ncbi:MAG: TonB-dependent receptor [Arcicella sp.]|nr:TonB-dependent receptor [Arcicella sp.]
MNKNILQKLLFGCFAFLFSQAIYAQEVKGTVTSADENEVLPGVSVVIKGTTTGTVTNANGTFSIKVPNSKAILVLSSVGFTKQEVAINGQSQISVKMQIDEQSLSEVVVVGYGEVKRNNLTGAASSISSKEIEERPISRLEGALAGQLPGVDVRTNSGEPGGAIQIRVRGTGSINSSNDPLYVVDGVPVDDINGLNPSDVKSIDVLKDAASAAIYGSRGSNGVVIITTKRGNKGKLNIQFNTSKSFQRKEGEIDMMSPEQWIQQRKEGVDAAWVARGVALKKNYKADDSQEFRAAELKIPVTKPNTTLMYDPKWAYGTDSLDYVDWNEAFFGNTGQLDNYSLAVSGGSENMNFSISGSFVDQKGIVRNTGYQRGTLRANFDAKINKFLRFGLTLAPSVEWLTGAGSVDGKDNTGMQAIQEPPISPLGVGYYAGAQPFPTYPWSGRYWSPIAQLERIEANGTRNRLNANSFININFTKSLSLKLLGGVDNNSSINDRWQPSNAIRDWSTLPYPGYGSVSDRRETFGFRYLGQATLNYSKKIKSHNIIGLLGYSIEATEGSSSRQNNSRFPNDWSNLFDQTTSTVSISSISADKTALLSYFGRMMYDYKDKYLLSASLRRDGSSKFGADNQWGIFPAASVAWKVSQENFMQNLTFIDDLKLRASYGVSGNNRIPSNAQFALLSTTNYPLNGAILSGYAPGSFENRDLGWEKNTSYNAGIDFSILKGRIQTSIDYYSRTTTDLLLRAPVSSLTGFTTSWQNVGDILNKGLEISITAKNNFGGLGWVSVLNASYNTNEVLRIGYDNTPIASGFSGLTSIIEVGQPLYSFKLYDAIGVYKDQADVDAGPKMAQTKPGDSKYRDVDGNGVINDKDRTIVGNPQAPYVFGFRNDFTYKRFTLSTLLNAQVGGKIYSMIGRSIDRPGMGYLYNKLAKWENRWKSADNPGDGMTPSITATTGSFYDTRWLYSSDYLRIKNINLGYNIPKQKWFNSARVFISIENAFIWHKYSGGYTPEAANNEGGDYGGYPQSKSYSLGLNLNL